MDSVAVSVRGISKCYRTYVSPRARLLDAIWPGRRAGGQEIWALRDIDFEVKAGESFAVIGRNGSGKSTLLEILAGTLTPTAGAATVSGRVSALLELGSGFKPEYTGRDNVVLSGLLLGLSREEILRRFDEIAAFADIGDAIDRPVGTYSSGMMMRLAFSVQVLANPDILIIDEALSVGDFFFQQKCLGYLRELRERGVTLLFVSHNTDTLRTLCDRGLVLRQGGQIFCGSCGAAIRHYMQYGFEDIGSPRREAVQLGDVSFVQRCQAVLNQIGATVLWKASDVAAVVRKGGLLAIEVADESGVLAMGAVMGEKRIFRLHYCSPPGTPVRLECIIQDRFEQVITGFGSMRLGISPILTTSPEYGVLEVEIELWLKGGEYSIRVALVECPQDVPHVGGAVIDAAPLLGPITIFWDYEKNVAPFPGIAGLPVKGCLIRPFDADE
jgi:lipopolysaccharide transport system ATP-binding protein